jgi:hypothetical protein
MWLMGRLTGWAVTLVLAPLQVTLVVELFEPEPEPDVEPEPPLVLLPLDPVPPPLVEEPPVEEPPVEELPDVLPPLWPVPVPDGAEVVTGEEFGETAPASCTPSLSLQAVSESAASATVAAAKRRVRGRAVNADMVVIPFGEAGGRPPSSRSAGGVL